MSRTIRAALTFTALLLGLTLGFLAREAGATVPVTLSSVSYTCNGSQFTYTIPFPYQQPSDITVVQTGGGVTATLVNGTGYTLSVYSTSTTASITIIGVGNCANTYVIRILRQVPLTQLFSFRTQGGYNGTSIENAFDRQTMMIQQLSSTLDGGTFSGVATSVAAGAINVTSPITGDGTSGNHLGLDETANYAWSGSQSFAGAVTVSSDVTAASGSESFDYSSSAGHMYTPTGVFESFASSNTFVTNIVADGGVSIHGLLAVDGGEYVNGGLLVDGGLSVSGREYLNGVLDVDGGASIQGLVLLGQDIEINGDLQEDSDSVFQGQVDAQSLFTAEEQANFNDNVIMARGLTVDGGVSIHGLLAVDGGITASGPVTLNSSSSAPMILTANAGTGLALYASGNTTRAPIEIAPQPAPSNTTTKGDIYFDSTLNRPVYNSGVAFYPVPKGVQVSFSSSQTATFTVESGSLGCVCTSSAHTYTSFCAISTTTATISSATSNSDIWNCIYW